MKVRGRWGVPRDAGANYALYVEIGTSIEGPTAEERELAAGGDMSMIAPPIGPLMAPRPTLRPAADEEYPGLATRIAAVLAGRPMP